MHKSKWNIAANTVSFVHTIVHLEKSLCKFILQYTDLCSVTGIPLREQLETSYGAKFNSHLLNDVLCNLHWLPLHLQVQFNVLLRMYKALNGLGISHLRDHVFHHMIHDSWDLLGCLCYSPCPVYTGLGWGQYIFGERSLDCGICYPSSLGLDLLMCRICSRPICFPRLIWRGWVECEWLEWGRSEVWLGWLWSMWLVNVLIRIVCALRATN